MKKNTNVYVKVLVIGFLFFIPQQIEAQFLKKLQQRAEDKIEREAEKRAQRRIDKTIDKGFDEIEDTIDGKNTKKTSGSTSNKNQNSTNQNTSSNQNSSPQNSNQEVKQASKPTVVWSRFDFIPGDKVVFENGPSAEEENGEFPSRWDLVGGSSEIMEVDGENVICFPQGGIIVPYLKNSNEDYLPEIFTVELDAYFKAGYSRRLWIKLYDQKNQKKLNYKKEITLHVNSVSVGETSGTSPNKSGNKSENGGWRHISIAFTKGKLKVYIDDTRLINIPHFEANPTGITLSMDGYSADKPEDIQYVKNIRIAKGGVKYYDRVLSEGKIIVNGIKFDTNKATLKPESMGPINEIYQLMQKQPDLNFSVEGHTDSDGNDASNQTLSEARGKAVMDQLIAMGISANRLKSTGFGESKPLDTNSTPEGKANNRRVEFVKFTGNSNSNTSSSNGSSSAFEQLDKKTIGAKLESLPDSFKIPVSNNSGVVNGKGTVIIYATSDGNLGKLEILDVDKYDHNKLTIKYVTYNYNGSVHSESNHLEVIGTYTCDLDKGTIEDVSRDDVDFWYKVADKYSAEMNATESTIFKIYK